jgi:DNA-binding IclR family transcriptional regulator
MRTRKSETVGKALLVFDQFLVRKRPLTLTELSVGAGIHKTTMMRLCNALVDAGYLHRNESRSYVLAPKIWELALIYVQQVDMERVIRPLIRRLRDETMESASFYIRDVDFRVCMFRENSPHRVHHHVDEGTRLPLREGVVGYVLLAFSGEAGPGYDTIRADGYFEAKGREPDTASVAAPVFARNGEMVGAVVVSGPSSRFGAVQRKKALKLVLECCHELGTQIPDRKVFSNSNDQRH